ncbi:MAG: HAMP domain-containing protein [Deltaproteobacteria bacterium]|nr:HAMP domain-containing protein [Deltaproteobacteria bacterium]
MKLTYGLRGLRAQLVSGIVIITIAAIGFMGVLSITLLQANALRGKINEAEDIARLLRLALPGEAAMPAFGDYARKVMKDLGIPFLKVSDYSGRMVFTEGRDEEARGEVVFFEDGIKIYRAGIGVGSHLYVIVAPSLGGGVTGQSVSFIVSLADIDSYVSTMRRFMVLYALLDSVIIIAFGVYFLSFFIIRPVKRLEGAASRIAAGELGVRADVRTNDEIGSLAAAFNTMAARLREEFGRLERMNTELLDREEELLKTRTLASTGRLAAGVAHEIGNPLGVVSGYLDILGRGLKTREEEKDIIKRMEKEVSRINSIVREFLDISRPSVKPPEETDLNAVIKETVELFSFHRDFKGVKAELKLKGVLPPVMIDGDKLRQVFMNLLINAAEAMPQGGVITVETDKEGRRAGHAAVARKRSGDTDFTPASERRLKEYVVASFIDRGSGINKEELDKIFDPFFTTKPPGKGTGLGLFISESIIKAYGGTIEAESEPGKGSIFRVLLPARPSSPPGDKLVEGA